MPPTHQERVDTAASLTSGKQAPFLNILPKACPRSTEIREKQVPGAARHSERYLTSMHTVMTGMLWTVRLSRCIITEEGRDACEQIRLICRESSIHKSPSHNPDLNETWSVAARFGRISPRHQRGNAMHGSLLLRAMSTSPTCRPAAPAGLKTPEKTVR